MKRLNWFLIGSLIFLLAAFVLGFDNGGDGGLTILYALSRNFATASIVFAVIGSAQFVVEFWEDRFKE